MYIDDAYTWEGDEGVIQQLVFENEQAFEAFKVKCPNYKNSPNGSSLENDKGAIFKMRAVKCGNGTWHALIRGGKHTGLLIVALNHHDTWPQALQECLNWVNNK